MKIGFTQRKAHMTLLETLIALSLLAVLLSFVFGIFRELSFLSYKTEQSQRESFQMRYVESRLGFIFERIVNEKKSDRIFYFYTEPPNRDFSDSPSLILTFDNGVRLDPHFSGDILGRLYVDFNHCLCLAMWPLHVPHPDGYLHEEVLLSHVVDVNYSFYAPPEQLQQRTDISTENKIDPNKKEPERNKWHENEWLLSYRQMPSIVKVIVTVAQNPEKLKQKDRGMDIETKSLTFHFVLPSSKNPIYYPQD